MEKEREAELNFGKTASIKGYTVTDDDMAKINAMTVEPLTKEDVYIFKTVACDNMSDDRNYMPFKRQALDDMKELYVGKTILEDHISGVANQIGRVFDATVVEKEDFTDSGEKHAELILKGYMLRIPENESTIKAINAGIRKEVSTNCRPKLLSCNICKSDGFTCFHFPGVIYRGERCTLTIDSVKDAFELSFVAVPAQPRAGITKKVKTEDDFFAEKNKEIEATCKKLNLLADSYKFLAEKGLNGHE